MKYMIFVSILCLIFEVNIYSNDTGLPFPQGSPECGVLVFNALQTGKTSDEIAVLLKKNKCNHDDSYHAAFNLATEGLTNRQKWQSWQIAARYGEDKNKQANKWFYSAVTGGTVIASWVVAAYFGKDVHSFFKSRFTAKPVVNPPAE